MCKHVIFLKGVLGLAKKKKVLKKEKSENNIASVVNALQEVRNSEYVKNIYLFEHDFQRIIDRLLDDSFRLAVVGEFSSGKSTFLNALIGRDLLKHGAKETTATVTEIHNKKTEESETYLDVYYLNGNVETNVSVDRITDYTATSSSTHAVAKEIEKVVINSQILDSDAKVCFVDTPGLNGVADNHREKTIEEIKNAHACIYLMQVRGLGQSDIDFLKYISKYQYNIIFVQNFIDELKKLEGETPEQKVQQQKKIIEEKLISENPEIHYEIVAVSSRKALIAKSFDFKTYNGEILTEDLRDVLYDESRFDAIFNIINNLMNHNEKEKTQQRDAVAVALNLLEQLKEIVSFENNKEIIAWETSIDGRNSANYTIDILDKLQLQANIVESLKAIDQRIVGINILPHEISESVDTLIAKFGNTIENIQTSYENLAEDIEEQEKARTKKFNSIMSEIRDATEGSNEEMVEEIEKLADQYAGFEEVITTIVEQMSHMAKEDIKVMKSTEIFRRNFAGAVL